jgi:hypothetical protein
MKIEKEKVKYIHNTRGGRTVRLKLVNGKVVESKPEGLPAQKIKQ